MAMNRGKQPPTANRSADVERVVRASHAPPAVKPTDSVTRVDHLLLADYLRVQPPGTGWLGGTLTRRRCGPNCGTLGRHLNKWAR